MRSETAPAAGRTRIRRASPHLSVPSSGQESESPAGSGVQQAGHSPDGPEEPLAGPGPAEVFREAAEAGDQHGAGEQTLAGVPAGSAHQVGLEPPPRCKRRPQFLFNSPQSCFYGAIIAA